MTQAKQREKIAHLLREAIVVHLRPYWRVQGLLAAIVVAAVLAETAVPLTIRYLIDQALLPHDAEKFAFAIVVLVVLFAASAGARLVQTVVRAYMTRELYRDLFIRLFRSLHRLPSSFFDRARPGHFSPLFDTELVTFAAMVRDLLERGLHAVLQFAVVMTTLFILNWQLALVVACILPLLAIRPRRHLAPTLGGIDAIRRVIEGIVSAVHDYVSTQTLVRAFGRTEDATRRFSEESVGRKGPRDLLAGIADVRRTLGTPQYKALTFKLSMDNQQAGITLIVIGAGAYLSFVDVLSLGTFSAFILLLPGVMAAITRFADYVQDLGRATLSLDRIDAVERSGRPALESHTPVRLGTPTRGIRFEQLDFGYSKESLNLQGVNLSLPMGESVAFVGRSGAGKSTLFRLLLGFYDPSSGRVAIDGHDVREIDPATLGAQLGAVLQPSQIINASVRDNIRFARPDASDEEVTNAARLAGIHDFVASLPNGYDSPVGESGKWFSEGQRQRLALARAILPSPSILLLDEVTAALDPETESAINATIQQLASQRTVMLVTHRLASAAFVDHIVVMDQGQVKEEGRHDELLARGGLYHQLWQMQTGFVVSGDGLHAEVSGERLRAIPLFREVEPEILEALAGRFVSRAYEPGQTIYAQGDAGDKFYIVVRGTISISTMDAGQQSIRLADLQDGDYFGEVEMVNKGRRTTTVNARTPSLVLALRAEHFENMVEELGALSKVVTQMALGRSLSTICSVGRRRRAHPIWKGLRQHIWD